MDRRDIVQLVLDEMIEASAKPKPRKAPTYQIYRNLSKSKGESYRWSIRQRGKVLTHRGGQQEAFALDVTFKVSEAGRQRVLTNRQKNVHAFAVAQEVAFWSGVNKLDDLRARGFTIEEYDNAVVVRYNPYWGGFFTASGTIWDRGYWAPDVCSGRRLVSAGAVICDGRGMYALRPKFA